MAQKDQNLKLILSKLITQYQAFSPEREKQITNLRREKHNLKNQLVTIYYYAQHNQHQEIINFIEKLITVPEYGLTSFSICKNLIIDTLLLSKIKVAEENNISFTYDIFVPAQLPFNDIDLCDLIGNALDNAFEACSASSSCAKKYIYVSIKYKKQCLYCYFENTFSHRLRYSTDSFYSTKFDTARHGHGLESIKIITQKYNGLMNIYSSESCFSLKILLFSEPL